MNIRHSRIVVAGVCAFVAVSVTACGGDDGNAVAEPATSVAAATEDSVTEDSVTATTTGSVVAPTTAPDDGAEPYRAESLQVTGATDRVDYDVVIPQLGGGDPAVVAEFDESMRTALQDMIDGPGTERYTLSTGQHEITRIGDRVVAGLLVVSYNMNPPGAHPTPLVATVVVNTDTATPVTLSDVFPDLQAGLQRLSEQSALLLPDTAAGPNFQRSGIEPTESNFANWLPTPEGMEIHFGDYQVGPHAVGLVTVTVPWDALADVADPDVVAVLAS